MDEKEQAEKALADLRAEEIDHLYCGHCGGIDDVQAVNLIETVRHLCQNCRTKILNWI